MNTELAKQQNTWPQIGQCSDVNGFSVQEWVAVVWSRCGACHGVPAQAAGYYFALSVQSLAFKTPAP